MNSKRHLFINKYFAFAVVVFAVLSGVSDSNTIANASTAKDGKLGYILSISNLLIKSTGKITAFNEQSNDFKEYVQVAAVKDSIGSIYKAVVFGVFIFTVFHIKNKLEQNNIWRSAVF